MSEFNPVKKWNEMVSDSQELKEDFNNMPDTDAILWANNQMRAYKEAMLLLAHSSLKPLNEAQKGFVEVMVRRAEANENS